MQLNEILVLKHSTGSILHPFCISANAYTRHEAERNLSIPLHHILKLCAAGFKKNGQGNVVSNNKRVPQSCTELNNKASVPSRISGTPTLQRIKAP